MADNKHKDWQPNKSASPIRSPYHYHFIYVIIIIIDIDIRSFEWVNCLWANRDLILCSSLEHNLSSPGIIFIRTIAIGGVHACFCIYLSIYLYICFVLSAVIVSHSLVLILSFGSFALLVVHIFYSFYSFSPAWARSLSIMLSRHFDCFIWHSAYKESLF